MVHSRDDTDEKTKKRLFTLALKEGKYDQIIIFAFSPLYLLKDEEITEEDIEYLKALTQFIDTPGKKTRIYSSEEGLESRFFEMDDNLRTKQLKQWDEIIEKMKIGNSHEDKKNLGIFLLDNDHVPALSFVLGSFHKQDGEQRWDCAFKMRVGISKRNFYGLNEEKASWMYIGEQPEPELVTKIFERFNEAKNTGKLKPFEKFVDECKGKISKKSYHYDVFKPKIAILTAMQLELDAVVGMLKPKSIKRDNRDNIHGTLGNHKMVILPPSYGIAKTAIAATKICNIFDSVKILIFLGVAGGSKKAPVGTIVIANHILDYDNAKLEKRKQQNRSSLKPPSPDARDKMHQMLSLPSFKQQWINEIEKIRKSNPKWKGLNTKIEFGVIGSGGKIVNDERFRDGLITKHNIIAFDTESTGLAETSSIDKTEYFVIRGISDLSNGKRKDNVKQPYAAIVAMTLLKMFLEREPNLTMGKD